MTQVSPTTAEPSHRGPSQRLQARWQGCWLVLVPV
jgi:hypothetical protein